MIKTYDPQVKVVLLKGEARSSISYSDLNAPVGDDISDRYNAIGGQRIDLSPYLGDGGGVRTSKSVREPAGGFTVTLLDKMFTDYGAMESLYGLIEPMDMVEIRFCHDSKMMLTDNCLLEWDGIIPIIMRGFVTEIRRDEAIGQDGRPTRRIVISGHDSGKILEIFMLYYLSNQALGQYYMSSIYNFLEKFGEGFGVIRDAKGFLEELTKVVINPFFNLIVGTVADKALRDGFVAECSASGSVAPQLLSNFNNVSLYQLMKSVLDVGVFNELYIEDRPSSIALVLRPCPYADTADRPIQSAPAVEVTVNDYDIQSISVSRTDHGVSNWFWVQNNHWNMVGDVPNQIQAQTANATSVMKWDYPNCAANKYGFRNLIENVSLGPPSGTDDKPTSSSEKTAQDNSTTAKWLESRRIMLGNLNKDNVVFETGTMRVKGDENIKAGVFIKVVGNTRKSKPNRYYAVSVDHDFVPFQGFFTTISFERGTGFINRAEDSLSPYNSEWDRGGL